MLIVIKSGCKSVSVIPLVSYGFLYRECYGKYLCKSKAKVDKIRQFKERASNTWLLSHWWKSCMQQADSVGRTNRQTVTPIVHRTCKYIMLNFLIFKLNIYF